MLMVGLISNTTHGQFTCEMLHWTQELAVVHAVGQSHSVTGVNESHVEDSFHGRLIEAGESLPGVRWLHLSRGHNSDKSRQQIQAQTKPSFSVIFLNAFKYFYVIHQPCSRWKQRHWDRDHRQNNSRLVELS